jgi:hypothetical protein
MKTCWTLIVTVAVCLGCVTLRAQELNPTVVVNMDALPFDQRVEVQSMANDVRGYLMNNRYTSEDWEGEKIPVDVTIYLMARNGNRYNARLAVVSKRLTNNTVGTGAALLRIFDQEWSFEWNMNPTLVYQPQRYEPFTSLLDFYMILAIGLDMDTYDDLAGDRVYRSAMMIAQNGSAAGLKAFSTQYQPGEFNRMALVTEITDIKYQGLRRLLFDYHDAVDLYANDKKAGQAAVAQTINDIAEYKKNKIANRSLFLQVFFDAKNLELADIFAGYKGAQVWSDLRYLDPGNTQAYEAARGK